MVKMKSKLLKLLYEYSANGKLVDGKYIQKLIEIVVDSKGIVDYAGGKTPGNILLNCCLTQYLQKSNFSY